MAPPRLPSLHPGGGALGAARPRRLSTLVEGSGGGRERGLSATASTAGTVTPKPIGDTPASEPHSEPHLPSTIHSSDSVWVGKAFFSRFFYGAFIIHIRGIRRYGQKGLPRNSRKAPSWQWEKRRLGNPCQINATVSMFAVRARVGVRCRLQHGSAVGASPRASTQRSKVRTGCEKLCHQLSTMALPSAAYHPPAQDGVTTPIT